MKLSESALEGQTFQGAYKISSKLGKGGMAWVYKGEHMRLGGQIAIKVLASIMAAEPESRSRFLREARLQYDLQHTNIVRVIDMVEEDELCAIVMEWCDGGDLHQWFQLRNQQAIEPSDVRKLLLPILDALSFAHARGIVHRDLKPQNILLTGSVQGPIPKLTDFGVAKELGGEGQTVTGSTVGTIRYISPEQLRDSKRVDHRSDIYSFGAMLYLMLTGHHAFQGQGPEVLTRILAEPAPFPHEAPPPFQPILIKCLQKDPEDRYQSCGHLKEALLDALSYFEPSQSGHYHDLPTPDPALFAVPAHGYSQSGHSQSGYGYSQSASSQAHTASKRGSGPPLTTPMNAPGIPHAGAYEQTEHSYPPNGNGGPATEPMQVPSFAGQPGEPSIAQQPVNNGQVWIWQFVSIILVVALGLALFVMWRGQAAQQTHTPPKAAPSLRKATVPPSAGSIVRRKPPAKTSMEPTQDAGAAPDTSPPQTPRQPPPKARKQPDRRLRRRRRPRRSRRRRRKYHKQRTKQRRKRRVARANAGKAGQKVFKLVPPPGPWPTVNQGNPFVTMTLTQQEINIAGYSMKRDKDPARVKEAFYLMNKACNDFQYSAACGNIGIIHARKDPKKAIKYMRKACMAKVPHPWSCVHYGLLHTNYWGPSQDRYDLAKACRIFSRACDLGSKWGCGSFNVNKCGEPLKNWKFWWKDKTHMPIKTATVKRSIRISAYALNALAHSSRYRYYSNKYKERRVGLLAKACRLGQAQSCHTLGMDYRRRNKYAISLFLLSRACDAGRAKSCRTAGWMMSGRYAAFDNFYNMSRACKMFLRSCQGKKAASSYFCRRRLQSLPCKAR